jgi:hypothetical protein
VSWDSLKSNKLGNECPPTFSQKFSGRLVSPQITVPDRAVSTDHSCHIGTQRNCHSWSLCYWSNADRHRTSNGSLPITVLDLYRLCRCMFDQWKFADHLMQGMRSCWSLNGPDGEQHRDQLRERLRGSPGDTVCNAQAWLAGSVYFPAWMLDNLRQRPGIWLSYIALVLQLGSSRVPGL